MDPQGSEWQPAAGPSYLDRIAEDISLPSDFHLVIVEPGGNFAERLERVHEALVFAR